MNQLLIPPRPSPPPPRLPLSWRIFRGKGLDPSYLDTRHSFVDISLTCSLDFYCILHFLPISNIYIRRRNNHLIDKKEYKFTTGESKALPQNRLLAIQPKNQ